MVELTSGEAGKPGMKRGKCGVVSHQRISAEKAQQSLLSSRDCHSYYSLSDWGELAFLLSERSSSENRTRLAGVISAN